MRYLSDKQCGGERKALKTAEAKLAEAKLAEAKLAELKALLEKAPRRQGKLTKTAEAKARKLLKAD